MVKVINHPYTVRIEGRWRRSRAQRSVSPILTSEFDVKIYSNKPENPFQTVTSQIFDNIYILSIYC